MIARMTSARDEILHKLRASLDRHAPFTTSGAQTHEAAPPPVTQVSGDEDLRVRFMAEVERVKGVVHAAESEDDARQVLRTLLKSHNAQRVTMWDERYIPTSNIDGLLQEMHITRVQGEHAVVETADTGITGADSVIAATGTLVLSSGPGRSRMASLLPPVHIAIVTTSQIVPRLEDYIAAQRAGNVDTFRTASNVTLITGCSRTSDIEMQPVFGVHGPLELHIILIDLNRASFASSSGHD